MLCCKTTGCVVVSSIFSHRLGVHCHFIDGAYNKSTYRSRPCIVTASFRFLIFAYGIKRKGFPYSLLSDGPGADPGVPAVSPPVTVGHLPGGRLPLLSARHAVTFPATEHHRLLAGTKLYYLVTEAHRCEQFAEGCLLPSFCPSRI